MLYCRLLISFQNRHFRKICSRNTIRVTNSLDPNQARQNVGPDLGPNCLRRSSADGTSGQKINKIRMTDDDETPNIVALRLHQITCGTPNMHL